MKELKEGYYVRFRTLSNEVKIRKIIKIDNNIYELDKNEATIDKYIIGEPSENIIDLIEVGDYVNGYYAEDVFDTYIYVATGTNYFQSPTIYEQDIKSIVTKEQFNSVKYEVE